MTEDCGAESCYCCGNGHFCEPPRYPTALGQTWDCPDCGEHHVAFEVTERHHRADWVVRRNVPLGTLGWTTA